VIWQTILEDPAKIAPFLCGPSNRLLASYIGDGTMDQLELWLYSMNQ